MQDPVLHQAIAAWEKSSDDPMVREAYFARRKAVLDEKAAVREAELRLREAIQKGQVEGRTEGKEEVAKNLLAMGMEISKVAKATGMTEDEVKVLNE
ncbi:Signal transduction histidine kinase [Desulfosporosinus sp. I2]|nr:Signal transduction histidine kinase [Desulfosporosinus sp. I2]